MAKTLPNSISNTLSNCQYEAPTSSPPSLSVSGLYRMSPTDSSLCPLCKLTTQIRLRNYCMSLKWTFCCCCCCEPLVSFIYIMNSSSIADEENHRLQG
ncbi:hypothetical protein CEXT_257691 [Caerostris extrusa]|uniref:LITAF domain-containing protein n=1 Tax=Caerostris extrusa TaxID=172846 RepID=A0AAV4N3A4_CAEEX|nr:hypothetical protein CEXT_257691 [Caerostris extrusa]